MVELTPAVELAAKNPSRHPNESEQYRSARQELLIEADPGQDQRGAVEMDPLWLLLDTTREGRGTDWHPDLTY